MTLDALVASEISNRISDQSEERKGNRDAAGAVSRRNQRREKRAQEVGSGAALGELLSDTFNLSEEKEA